MTGRSALDLLNVYGDSSSEDEVPFGRVSTKRCHRHDSDDEDKSRKILHSSIKSRFSLPNIIKLEKDEVADDPSVHEGRIRSFPHEPGNWATYIYILYEDGNDEIKATVEKICDKLTGYSFKFVNDLHISLTKIVILRHHWIELFVSSIKESIIGINRFIIMFDTLNVYCNEERTRTFIGLDIRTGYDSLLQLVKIFNGCLSEFRLPEFYKDPSFHMSIAWCLGDVEDAVRKVLPQLNNEIAEMRSKFDDDNWYIVVDRICCKVGNKLFTFDVS